MDSNTVFFLHYVDHIGNKGSYGEVNFTRDPSGRITAHKTLKKGEDYTTFLAKAIYLSKEYVITKYLSGTGVVPQVYGRKMIVRMIEGVQVPLVGEIQSEFVGPSIKLCGDMGFLMEPKTMLRHLLQACAHLHHLDVLHLDLKPDNVTYDLTRRKVKLIDFGLSEMTSFLDIESEGGIKKWDQSPRCLSHLPFGQITNEGMLHSVAQAQLPYVQSYFHRPIRGRTRLRNAVNIPGYGEPIAFLSEIMGVSSGCVLDEKSDIYSVAMILLNHIGVCDLRCLWKKDCSQDQVLLNWLDLLVSVRGGSSKSEMLEIEKKLWEMSMICKADCSVIKKKAALRRAVRKSLIESGNGLGLYSQIGPVLGREVASVVFDMINPLPTNRPKATEALTMLSYDLPENWIPNVKGGRTAYYVDIVRDHILVGRVFENGVWSASLSVDLENGSLLWSKGTKHFKDHQDSHKHQVIDKLIYYMRDRVGGTKHNDHKLWFRSLSCTHLMFDDLYLKQ
jgi:serine/threonine protein kinase